MPRFSIWPFISKLLMALCALVLLGLFTKLVIAILAPVLAPGLTLSLNAGFTYLIQLLQPALTPIIALALLVLLLWAVLSSTNNRR
jgi:hypothetical protein